MGSLARYLQAAFAASCPRGWSCEAEVPLVDRNAVRRLGFEPRADVRLTDRASQRRIWVEFEVSRADPVANHAKFATAALLEGLGHNDCFVSMTSSHIASGRAALAAGTTIWMRSLGIPAFQVDLLPALDEASIKSLNAQPLSVQEDLGRIPVKGEVLRVIDVSSAAALASGHRIHKADNSYTVGINVRQWNADVATPAGASLWSRRKVQYFVFDAATEQFAPAKFCAFIPGPGFQQIAGTASDKSIGNNLPLGMSMDVYVQLGEQDPRFDGHVARKHLQGRLGYRLERMGNTSLAMQLAFDRWLTGVRAQVAAPDDASVLFRDGA